MVFTIPEWQYETVKKFLEENLKRSEYLWGMFHNGYVDVVIRRSMI